MRETNRQAALRLLSEARKSSSGARVLLVVVAGVHAMLECAEQARHIAQALVLLNEPTSSVDYRARLALLAQTVNYPPAGVDPAGNLAQTMQENDEERARRREEEASDGENV